VPDLKQAREMEKFLAAVESRVIEMARREGVIIRVERDTRGRYPTFVLRTVLLGEHAVLSRKYNGKRYHKRGGDEE
jgi:hypothetical protein